MKIINKRDELDEELICGDISRMKPILGESDDEIS
jgi:hypothetical protein